MQNLDGQLTLCMHGTIKEGLGHEPCAIISTIVMRMLRRKATPVHVRMLLIIGGAKSQNIAGLNR